jgi:hypothetical protein
LIGDPNSELLGRIEIDSRGVHTDTGSGNDLQTAGALLHMLSGDLAFSADHRIHATCLQFPPLLFKPGIYDDKFHSLPQPIKHSRLKFFYQNSAQRHILLRPFG